MVVVKDHMDLQKAKRDVNNSYDYTGTEKLAKCQELGEVSQYSCCGCMQHQCTQIAASQLKL